MVSCLACATDPLPQTPARVSQGRRLDPREALRRLKQSKTPNQLKQIHAQILRNGLSSDPTLLSNLIRLYSSHRRLDLASRVFSQFPNPPTFAWNLMIRAHTANSSPFNAILLYNRMMSCNVPPDKFTFPFVAKACSALSNLTKGKEIHAYAIKAGLYSDLFLQNTLIHLYFTCGHPVCGRKVFGKMRVRSVVSWTALVSGLVACREIEAARQVFEMMPVRNVVTWTAMIDGCTRNGRPDEAFKLFRRMLEDKVRPNEYTLVGLLIACTELGSLGLGRWVHDFAHKNGGLERGVYVGTALIDMYSKCGSLEDAVRVFDQMPVRSLATWNSMITSLGVHGFGREAVEIFKEMEKDSVRPDGITLIGVLCACAREGMVEEGWRLFRYMSENYGIELGIEHYRCLLELLDCEEVEMFKEIIMEFDVGARRMLLMACTEQGNLDREGVVRSCIDELKVSEGGIGGLVRLEGGCYEWEVG